MAWIESHQELGRHPKTLRLAVELKCSVPCAVGYVHFLWWWALDYAPDGLVVAANKPLVAQACLWMRKPELFWTALETSGFVEPAEEPGVVRIHDWTDYSGKLKTQRALRKESNRRAQQRRRQQKVSADVSVVSAPNQQPTVQNTTVQNSSPPLPPLSVSTDAATETQCPMGPHTFRGAYAEHLATDPRHQVKRRDPSPPSADDTNHMAKSDHMAASA
jgi:hypothetical protein